MIDYIKAHVVGADNSRILKNENFDFEQRVNVKTGLLENKLRAKYKSLAFEYYSNTELLKFRGSLHKFFNEGEHNFNDFSLSDLNKLESQLYNETGIKYENLRLNLLEFGVNVLIPVEVKEVLDCVLFHKGKAPSKRDTFRGKGDYLMFSHNRYDIKLYDKGKQYNIGQGLLRAEIRFINWTEYRKKGFHTLRDVIDKGLYLLKDDLLNKWNDLILFDPLNLNPSHPEYKAQAYWEGLQKKSGATRKKHKDRLKNLNRIEGSDIQNRIAQELEKKLIELLKDEDQLLPTG